MRLIRNVFITLLVAIAAASARPATHQQVEQIARLNWVQTVAKRFSINVTDMVSGFDGLIDSARFVVVDSVAKVTFSTDSILSELAACLGDEIRRGDAKKLLAFYQTDLGRLANSLNRDIPPDSVMAQLMQMAMLDDASIDSTLRDRYLRTKAVYQFKRQVDTDTSRIDSTHYFIVKALNHLQAEPFRFSPEDIAREIELGQALPREMHINFEALAFMRIFTSMTDEQYDAYLEQEKQKHVIRTDLAIATCFKQIFGQRLVAFNHTIKTLFPAE